MNAFLCISTQWRVSFGSIIGLDYAAVKETLNGVGMSFKRVFNGLRIIEQHVIHLARSKHAGR